jgi:hypothetical protein
MPVRQVFTNNSTGLGNQMVAVKIASSVLFGGRFVDVQKINAKSSHTLIEQSPAGIRG